MKSADLIISRAGASTIAEIMATKTPSILIPSHYVANNHQYYNALDLVDKKISILLEEKDLNKESLTEAKDLSQIDGTIANVLSNDSSWKESSSITELVSSLQKIFDTNGINTKASNRLLDRVSKSKGIVSALSTVYNSILAGSNEAVIK